MADDEVLMFDGFSSLAPPDHDDEEWCIEDDKERKDGHKSCFRHDLRRKLWISQASPKYSSSHFQLPFPAPISGSLGLRPAGLPVAAPSPTGCMHPAPLTIWALTCVRATPDWLGLDGLLLHGIQSAGRKEGNLT